MAVREAHENRFFPPSQSVENFLVKRLWGVRIRVGEKLSIKKKLRSFVNMYYKAAVKVLSHH